MDSGLLMQGLLLYACFIPVLTVHECAHAWTASKLGDDTARLLGRVSLNPAVHMEVIGTVVLPLLGIFLAMSGSVLAGFIIGWGKPVPVNIFNLGNPRRDDTLVALAGPASNIVMAFVFMGVAKIGQLAGSEAVIEFCLLLVRINLFLAFFNMLPIPPLDGSHVLKNATQMSHETYYQFAQYGFIAVIVAINIPGVRQLLADLTMATASGMAWFYNTLLPF